MRLPLFLLALAALLSWGALHVSTLQSPDVVPAQNRQAPSAPAPSAAAASELQRPDLQQHVHGAGAAASVDAPPLFRPAETPAALQAPQPGQSFTLIGLAGTGADRTAFLRDSADQQTFQARAGEFVRGWRVDQTSERCARLSQARRAQEVCLP